MYSSSSASKLCILDDFESNESENFLKLLSSCEGPQFGGKNKEAASCDRLGEIRRPQRVLLALGQLHCVSVRTAISFIIITTVIFGPRPLGYPVQRAVRRACHAELRLSLAGHTWA